jgi:RNA polymerase sigma-70 factor (ECF subfamily)
MDSSCKTRKPSQEFEAGLIQRIVSGERDLFHDLIRPYERTVYSMLYSMLKNESEAEDAAQVAMISAYTGLKNFRSEAKFSTWLVTIALNEGRQRLRKAGTVREDSIDAMTEEADGDWTPALLTDWREVPSSALETKELRMHLQRAIADLPEIYRQVVMLRDVEELDVEETAQMLGVPGNTVKVRLHRARRMLQKELAPVLKDYAPKRGGGWMSWMGSMSQQEGRR